MANSAFELRLRYGGTWAVLGPQRVKEAEILANPGTPKTF